jgi:hypothetical protein
MRTFIQHRTPGRTGRELLSPSPSRRRVKILWVLLVAGTLVLSACGGGSSSNSNNNVTPLTLTGNWQFTVSSPPDGSFSGGIQGGFLLQGSNSATGAATYSVALPAQGGGNPTVCSSGSAAMSGTLNGESVTLTATAGTQIFSFTGMLSLDGTTMLGTYTSTAGTAADGSPCGTAQTGLQWTAVMVPPLFGSFQGSFHSTGGAAGLNNQDFLVSGVLLQGPNTGASSATVTGSVGFADPITLQPDYPCAAAATLTGTISGNSVTLQMTGVDGSNLGQIGGLPGSGLGTVTFDSTQRGLVLHSSIGTAYALSSSACPGGSSPASRGDSGNVCMGFSGSACQQPFTLSPASLTFPPQSPGSTSAAQKITLTNMSPTAMLTGLTWTFVNNGGAPNFAVAGDTCDPSGSALGSTFLLDIGKSCTISINFSPQASCATGNQPSQCPSSMTASLTLTSPASVDNDTAFAVPISGTTSSALAASNRKALTENVNRDRHPEEIAPGK